MRFHRCVWIFRMMLSLNKRGKCSCTRKTMSHCLWSNNYSCCPWFDETQSSCFFFLFENSICTQSCTKSVWLQDRIVTIHQTLIWLTYAYTSYRFHAQNSSNYLKTIMGDKWLQNPHNGFGNWTSIVNRPNWGNITV